MVVKDETSAVAERHRFDERALEDWCAIRIEDFGRDLNVRQIKGGASNPTFLLATETPSGPKRYILRKKPPGRLLQSAHQVEREYRIMHALEKTDIPVPRMRALCEDASVIGTAFYVMDFVEGRIFRDAPLPGLPREERAAIYDALNATLARLHQVDYAAIGLADYGRPGNYFERQIARFIKQYRGAQTDDIPEMEWLIDYLPKHVPDEPSVTIAHGDYRLENVMFHPVKPEVVAVLDWELSTIGHPIADLAFNCLLYHMEPSSFGSLLGVDFAATGIPTEAEYVAAYCRRTGRAGIENWNFYLAFSMFRLASIGQGVYKRALDGIATVDLSQAMGRGVHTRAQQAWRFVEGN